MKEVIKIRNNKKETLNKFLNIKNIKNNYLYTIDNKIIGFIKINPINIQLLTNEELNQKMELDSIEFSNEQYPYKFLIIPRTIDISEHLEEQKKLMENIEDEASIKIINNRINYIQEIISNINIIENEFYLLIYTEQKENAENELDKRIRNWNEKFKNCNLESNSLRDKDIINLLKIFTIPDLARNEGIYYTDNIIKIKKQELNVKNK